MRKSVRQLSLSRETLVRLEGVYGREAGLPTREPVKACESHTCPMNSCQSCTSIN